nr:TetR/AcrR family transcriptional regulator [Bacteroidota bacterium]
ILDAAVKVFAQNGYHNSKITTIAEMAGIATGSVYLYFENKEAILLTIFDGLWREYSQSLRDIVKRIDLDPLQKIDAIIEQLFKMFIDDPSLAVVFINEQQYLLEKKRGNLSKHFDEFMNLVEEVYKEGVRKRLFNAGIDTRIFRDFITSGLQNVLRQWARQPERPSLEIICNNIKQIIGNALLMR